MRALNELIALCRSNNGAAWNELCTIADNAARFPVQRLLQSHGFDLSSDDDVLQELYVHLRRQSCKRLSAFRGSSEVEFRVFLRRVAYRFACRLLAKWVRARNHEKEAVRHVTPPTRDGPTEKQIEDVRRELESIMSLADRKTLQLLWQEPDLDYENSNVFSLPAGKISQRTVRRWRSELFREYGNRI
jgi:hypothetical protein